MGDEKKDYIKGYIMCLISEGTFKDAKSPVAIVAKASAAFAKDAGAAVAEMTTQFAAANGPKLQAFAIEQAHGFFDNVLKHGLKRAWDDLKALHKAGMDANKR
jgi:hypothetical protein